ncbi:DUF669 domain-containing protein [Enterococcus sp. AZ103]|uniref:DUF669 domain-containing protein n=1 Tax=Enterococcus sp. AZ103 TaxID=2774628 RepID=UPI003F27521F
MALFVTDSQNTLGKSIEEAGSYNVKILPDSEHKLTKETKNDMAVLNYEVEDGKYIGGKVLYDNLVWDHSATELSVKRFNTVLAAIGVPDGTPIESINQLVTAMKGKRLNIIVDWKFSDYSGKWHLEVKGYQKTDPEGSKPNGVKKPNGQPGTQQSFPGIDPMSDNRSFGNGDFSGKIDISDDDLPF